MMNKQAIKCKGIDPRLLQWLESNLQVLACWRDEMTGIGPGEIDLINCLDTHHSWLSAELARLKA